MSADNEDDTEGREEGAADQQQGRDGPTQEGDGKEGSKGLKKKAREGYYVDSSSTLADPESLRAKEGEATFDADPLFSKTTKLFDENSAAGETRMGAWERSMEWLC